MLETAFTTMLHMSFLASVIAGVVLILRLLLKRRLPNTVFLCLWALVFLKLLLPFDIPSPTSLFNQIELGNRVEEVYTQEQAVGQLPAPSNDLQHQARADAPAPSQGAEAPAAQGGNQITILSALAWIWFCGAVLMMAGLCWLYGMNCRKFRRVQPVDDPAVQAMLASQKVKRRVRVGTLPDIHAPAVFGVFRPTLTLPADYRRFSGEALEYMLMHEIQHIKKRDNLWNLLALLLVCCHWFNPLVWLSYRFLNQDVELARDAGVLRSLGKHEKLDYAEVILRVAENRSKPALYLVAGFAEKSIKERVKSAIRYKKTTILTSALSIVLIGGIALVFATGAVRSAENPGSNAPVLGASSLGGTESAVPENSSGGAAGAPAEPASEGAAAVHNISLKKPNTAAKDQNAPVVLPERIEIKKLYEEQNEQQDYVSLCFAGDPQQYAEPLAAVIYPANATDQTVKWASSNPEAVAVSQDGVVTPLREGEAYITATTVNGKTAYIKVEAAPFGTGCLLDIMPILKIMNSSKQLCDEVMFLSYNENNPYSEQLTAILAPNSAPLSNVAWSSSDPAVLEVSQQGVITPKKSGSAVVTVTQGETGMEAQVEVRVMQTMPDNA